MFIYCDGSLHQGLTRAPLQYKDALLYFRGAAITRSHFKYINATYGLADAKAVVLTGGSAGGIATFLWQNYLKTIVKNPLAVLSIPDSGVFLNVESMQTKTLKSQFQLQNLYKVANKDEKTPI